MRQAAATLFLTLILLPGPGALTALAQVISLPAPVEVPVIAVPVPAASLPASGPRLPSAPALGSSALRLPVLAPLPRAAVSARLRSSLGNWLAVPAERQAQRTGRPAEETAWQAGRLFDGRASKGASVVLAPAASGLGAGLNILPSGSPRPSSRRPSLPVRSPVPRSALKASRSPALRAFREAVFHGPLSRAKHWIARAALLAAPILVDSGCGDPPVGPQTWVHPDGSVRVDVNADPFSLTVKDAKGNVLAESAPAHGGQNDDDPVRATAPLAITHNAELPVPTPVQGWDTYFGLDDPWTQSTSVTSFQTDKDALVAHVATTSGATVTLRIEPQGKGVRFVATLDGDPAGINRVSLGFRMHDDPSAGANGVPGDHFFGFGERFVRSDHRGQVLSNWVQDGGFGLGEDKQPGPVNPFPNGEGQTNIPVPWFLSPRGYGLLLNGTYRTVHHLGDETPDAWRVESWRPTLDATLFADPDPTALVEDLTGITGRPPAVADWVLAPRRRADPGSLESAKLRAAHIPTSVLDVDVHYFPAGGGADSASMKAITADVHARGFKAVAYFNPFINQDWKPVFEEAAAKGYLVKTRDGQPYVVEDYPNHAGMVDFTNPDAVAWYQGWLQRALDDGWDGWMYDFGEYVPRDSVLFNGMTGEEAHNLYPVLYQQAAYELLEKQKRGDYLIFVRSGFLGTGGKVPMVWAGDQNTDFDAADGLPAALTGALNAGMSGIPLWGSDIGGYHSIFNPPPDKELYLRWTELGGFSADMHDENNGEFGPFVGNPPRWSIWNDQESQDVYRKYASMKTRMLPYVRIAVREARERGTPVMRHLYLSYPNDPKVYPLSDEYMYGDSLLVAPVVKRGQTSRPVYLPDPAYYDFWSGERVAGAQTVTAPAPLGSVPVYAKIGAIVPLLHPDVETVVPSQDGSVVSAADRADYLEVSVFAGGKTSVTLDDGTVLSQSAPLGAFDPGAPVWSKGAIPAAASEAELQTCDACAWNDAPNHTWKVSVRTAGDTVKAGPLTIQVSSSPDVKRYVFTVRH